MDCFTETTCNRPGKTFLRSFVVTITVQGDQTESETCHLVSDVINAVISIAHSQCSSRGKGPLHFWLRPECVLICKIQISKYLRFFVFLLKLREREGFVSEVLKLWLNIQHTGRL